MKKLFLFIAALPFVFAAACTKDEEEEPIIEPTVEVFELGGYYEDNDDLVIKISGSTGTIVSFGTSDLGKDPATLNVGDEVLRNLHKLDDKTYEGERLKATYDLLEKDIDLGGWETVKIDRFVDHEQDFTMPGFSWFTTHFYYIGKTYTGGGGNTGGGGSQYKGTWVRQLGASGDETDLAIGNIPGEADNAVWMCEYKGNVGLYKGTISGSTITFDAQYGLPTYTVKIEDGQLWLKGNISNSLFTPYEKGSWTSHCGKLGN